MKKRPVILTIAGSDPSGGAGIQADLRTIHDLGGIGVSVITAITAQNTQGVQKVYPLMPREVTAQLESLLSDIHVDAVKVGMLGSRAVVNAVARAFSDFGPPNIVIDPVLNATTGEELLLPSGYNSLIVRLFPFADIVTPNTGEAESIKNVLYSESASYYGRSRAGLHMGAGAVLIKGGHLDGKPVDTLYQPGRQPIEFSGVRIPTEHTHGTGCFLSSAIATYLGHGLTLVEAIREAKLRMTEALQSPVVIGTGIGYPELPRIGGS